MDKGTIFCFSALSPQSSIQQMKACFNRITMATVITLSHKAQNPLTANGNQTTLVIIDTDAVVQCFPNLTHLRTSSGISVLRVYRLANYIRLSDRNTL
jgi:hypothetical protein